MNDLKYDLKPLYEEIKGYLSQTPEAKNFDFLDDKSLWDQYNTTVDLITEVTNENFNRFKIVPLLAEDGIPFIRISTYRSVLGGFINHLYSKYFPEENRPFSGAPSTIISQFQQQSQETLVQAIVDIQITINENMSKYKEDTKEYGFLNKIKNSLNSAKSITDILSKLVKTAKEFGLSLDDILKILGIG